MTTKVSLAVLNDAVLAALKGSISGLIQSNNASLPSNAIDISVGGAISDDATWAMQLTSSTTKRINAAWAAGDGNGGLDTGTKAANTWYYIWLIGNPTTGASDVLFSASASAPTMPSGYTKKRLIGAVKTNNTANIIAFKAVETAGGGIEVLWNNPPQDVAVTNQDTTAVLRTLSVPPAFKVKAHLNVFFEDVGSITEFYLSSPDTNDEAANAELALITHRSLSTTGLPGPMLVRAVNGQVRTVSSSVTANGTVNITTVGWEWSRR